MWLHKPRHDLQLSYKRSTTQTNGLKMRLIGGYSQDNSLSIVDPNRAGQKSLTSAGMVPRNRKAHHANIRQFYPIKEYRPRPRMTTLYIMRNFYEMKFYHKIILSDYFS